MNIALRKTRVMLIDDEPVVQIGVRDVLGGESEFDLVGEGCGSDRAIAMATELRPDVIVMEARLQKVDAIDAVRELRRRCQSARILAFTAFADEGLMLRAIDAGVNGYLLKRSPTARLVEAIRMVVMGGTFVDPAVGGRIFDIVRDRRPPVSSPGVKLNLSDRDQALLHLLAVGSSNRQIASQLHLAEQTVKNYVSHLLRQLGIPKRVLVMPYFEQKQQRSA